MSLKEAKRKQQKLTNAARASLEELRLDYEDFLRERGLLVLERLKKKGCMTL